MMKEKLGQRIYDRLRGRLDMLNEQFASSN